ncbi:hypothetical protein GOBAR_AA26389 [Gossypium barbadense]|uniref:F-box domain-containing protein n=1 Tax=Gossypium barbadense TaxID=3634 RepID=A0A2P5WT69_GOSBA|nr:hypothetical protein GOBAR_AA26389 [Gossypium barbadense]
MKNKPSFAFDPLSNAWFLLPRLDDPSSSSAFLGSNGFFFTTTPNFSYTPVLKSAWRFTSPLKFSRLNPLLGVFYDGSSGGFGFKFIVVGGVRFIGGLVDIEDRLAVEIYDPNRDSWELCPALPADFRSGNSSQSLSSALFKGKFYVFGIYSCFVSSFDLRNRVWSEVQTLRPPGVIFSFLIPCNDMLVLAGMCNAPRGPSFNLWKIDETTLEFSEISIMPQSLLHSLVESEEDENFASLKCVGMGNLIYVFNEEYHQKYPSCLCEISAENGKCSWRRVPQLPLPVNKFHKMLGVAQAGFGFKFIVVGGVRFIGGLVDIEDRLAVEIYDPNRDSWELCPALPADFRSGNSSQSLSSALFKGKFYVFGIYSCFVSSFDLRNRVWSEVQTLRPPGVIFSFLIPCNDMLVLAGMCNAPRGPSFNLWKIDETTLEFSEISIMPQSLLHSLVESEEDENFASLKCVGMGNLIYVFNEEYHQKYPSCLCEISAENGKCSWRRVPQLPLPVNKFHKLAQKQVQQQIIKNPTNCGCKTESCFHAEMSLKMPATVQFFICQLLHLNSLLRNIVSFLFAESHKEIRSQSVLWML